MSKLGHGAIATYSKNLLRSSSDILLDWIKSTQLVQIVGDEVVSAKKARELEGDITPKEKIKKLTKNQIESFVKNYEDETGINLPEDLKKSFRNTIKSIKTGNLNIKDEAYDEFYEDDDIRALFKELDIAYESHNYFKGGNKLMKLYELKNENLKKLRIRANGESMEVQGPIPEVNNEIIEIKDDIIALDNEAASNEDIDSTYTMNVDNTVNDLKGRIFDLMDKTSGIKELAVSYKDAFADSLIALLSVKSNFDLNVADRPAEEVLNNTETLAAEITEKTNNDDKINDRVEEVKEVTSTDADSLIFNPIIDATAQEVTGEEPVPVAEGFKDVAAAAGGAVSVAAVATLLIAIPVNLAIQKRNIKNESKFKSNFTFKQPLVASDQISAEFVSKYAKAIEVKSLIEAKALIESSIATADGGSVVARATRNNMLTPANITPKNIELFKKAPINYDELMATFSEAKPFIKKLNTDSLFLVPSLSSVVRRHAESFKVITDIKVPEASGEAGSFLATGRNAHPTYLDIEVSYKDPSDLTKLGGGTNTKKSTLGFHVVPRTLKSTEILTTLKEMGDFEDMKVLNGERESQKKLSNVIKFWKKKGTNNEKAVLSSNSFSAIIDKIENIKNPLFHLMLSYGEYMDLKDNGKIDLMNRETYKKIINKMPIISISIIDEERDVVYLSEGPYMSYTKHDGSDFIDSVSQYEKDLKTIIKYNQYQ